MEEFVYYNSLFDIYGSLLTDKEKITFRDYYHEDLSLQEIAEEKNISRSAVYKTLKTVIDKLKYYEDTLHLFVKYNKLSESLKLDSVLEIKEIIKKILDE